VWLSREINISPGLMWKLFWVAAGSFLPLLFLQYVGEEPIYPIVAQEMWAKQEFLLATLYGHQFERPAMYSWLILVVRGLLGQHNILVAARLITISSTLLIGLILAWLIRRIFKDRLFAAFAAAIFLSGDVLLYRGWLAHADPFFSLFAFGAMSCLWVAAEERRRGLLLLAALGLIGSFLAKALTGYIFYGVLFLVLLWRHPNRRFLLTPWSVAAHLAAVAFPLVWHFQANDYVLGEMARQVLFQSKSPDAPNLVTYIKLLVVYPVSILWYLMPVSAIVLYCLFAERISLTKLRQQSIQIALFTVAINVLPYWLSPGSSTRYIMALYPLFALVMTYIVLNSGAATMQLCTKALIGTIGIAYLVSLVGFPLYEKYIRGNYANAAKMIIDRSGNFPLYATDFTSVGLSIVANINALRAPQSPLTVPPAEFKSGYVLALEPDANVGQIDLTFELGRNADGKRTRYLLCRGAACTYDGKPTGSPLSF
jgi:4-amino-4-deoxy-L-arabinose transferase-like glycosyltransferase